MEHPTALPEEQTLTRVDTEAGATSLNRHRPRIIVTHEEPQATTKEARKIGEFPCATLPRTSLRSIFILVFVIKDLNIKDMSAVGLLIDFIQRTMHTYDTE
jgi:hypothetical protein